LTPRSGTKVSLHTWGLLPGAPTLTGTGLAPVGEVQRAMSASVPIESESIITSRRTILAILAKTYQADNPSIPRSRHPTLVWLRDAVLSNQPRCVLKIKKDARERRSDAND